MALPASLTLFVCPRCRDAIFKRLPRCNCITARTDRVPVQVPAQGTILEEVENG